MAAAGYRDWPCGTAHLCVLTAAEARGRGLGFRELGSQVSIRLSAG
jgi:hypothetical protein